MGRVFTDSYPVVSHEKRYETTEEESGNRTLSSSEMSCWIKGLGSDLLQFQRRNSLIASDLAQWTPDAGRGFNAILFLPLSVSRSRENHPCSLICELILERKQFSFNGCTVCFALRSVRKRQKHLKKQHIKQWVEYLLKWWRMARRTTKEHHNQLSGVWRKITHLLLAPKQTPLAVRRVQLVRGGGYTRGSAFRELRGNLVIRNETFESSHGNSSANITL